MRQRGQTHGRERKGGCSFLFP
uniref:Uncharacterized protein n=1 Tax=Anguilla anguilla TaxID=7936 RepID=A0A0E9RJG5_ANGAN